MGEQIKLYVAAAGGAFCLVLADLLANIDAATTLKLGGVIEKFVLGSTMLGPGMIGLLMVLGISVFFCWMYNPLDKAAAFTRGLSVFAVLSAVTPYSAVNGADEGQTPGLPPQQSVGADTLQGAIDQGAIDQGAIDRGAVGEPLTFSLFASAHADGTQPLSCSNGTVTANAILAMDKYVSSCKPYFSGFLGLGSFFNNTIEYCKSGVTLPKGAEVEFVQSWETSLRSYRYSKVRFQKGDQVCEGWVSDGRKMNHAVVKGY